MLAKLINLEAYTPLEFILFFGGFFLWAMFYVIIVRNILKYKFVEMPFVVEAGNIAWELLYAFVFELDMGPLLTWLYRAGTLLDVFIFYSLLKYGHKQLTIESVKKYFKPMVLAIFFAWGLIFWFYKKQGLDSPLGAVSAMQLNLIISSLYITLILRLDDLRGFSYAGALLKRLGTGLVTVFTFVHFPDNHFIHIVGVCIFILDGIYIHIFRRKMKEVPYK